MSNKKEISAPEVRDDLAPEVGSDAAAENVLSHMTANMTLYAMPELRG